MLSEVEWVAFACRFLQMAAMLSAFGVLLFCLLVLPRAAAERRITTLAGASLGLALLAGGTRLLAESATVSDAGSVIAAFAAAPDMVRFSRFGAFLSAQLAFLALALAFHGGMRIGQTGMRAALVGGALVLAAGSGHAAALPNGEGRLLWGIEALHLLAAGGWLGGLAPLFVTLRGAVHPEQAVPILRRFSTLAMGLVGVIAASALIEAAALIGGVANLLTTDYGRIALVKITLFVLLLGLAARNRFRLLPALEGGDPARAARALRRSFLLGMILGTFVLLAASLLATLGPASAQP